MPLATDSRNSPSPRSDGKRSFRRRTRKSWSQRDNIENALNTTLTSMAHLPVQKQSTRIRKRLGAEGSGDLPSTHCGKATRLASSERELCSATSPLLSSIRPTAKVATLQRTLSDKSSLLNQAASKLNDPPSSPLLLPSVVADPLHRSTSPLSAKPHRSTTPTSAAALFVDSKKRSRSTVGSTEGHIADDENDLLHLRSSPSIVRPLVKTKRPRSMSTRSSATPTGSLSLPPGAFAVAGQQSSGNLYAPMPRSAAMPIILVAEDNDDIFGSDTTLTSYDDSDDEGSLCGSQAAPSNDQADTHPASPSLLTLPPCSTTLGELDTEEPVQPSAIDCDQRVAMTEDDCTDNPEKDYIQEPPSVASLLPEDLVIRRGTTAPEYVSSSDATRSLMVSVLDKQVMVDEVSDTEGPFPTFSDEMPAPSPDVPLLLDQAVSTTPPKPEFVIPPVPPHRLHCTPTPPPAPPTLDVPRAAADQIESIEFPALKPAEEEPTLGIKTHQPQPMYRTCLEIMLERSSISGVPNVLLLKTMLQHNLSKGMQTIRDASDAAEKAAADSNVELTSEPLELDAWGQTIGNGRGLFQETEKARALKSRIEFRRSLVQQAFTKFDQCAPANWDKSSALLISTLNTDDADQSEKKKSHSIPYHGRGLWSSSIRGMISQLALPPSYTCDDCNRPFKLQSDLTSHAKLCRERAVHLSDQGESTASEPEENRRSLRSRTARQRAQQDQDGSDTEMQSEVEEGVIRCVCESREDEGSMIQCDKCYVWLHLDCVGLDDDNVPDEYYCPTCLGLPLPRINRRPTRASRSQRRKVETTHPMMPRYGLFSPELDPSDKENDGTLAAFSLNGATATSPQVVLNHDWDDDTDMATSNLGYDRDYMASMWGTSAHSVFKQKQAPALMLDGSSNLDSNLGLDDIMPVPMHLHSHLEVPIPTHGLDLNSDDPSAFHESNTFGYLPPEGGVEGSALSSDGFAPELLLNSEDTIESEGLHTPVEGSRDDIWELNDMDDLEDVYCGGLNFQRHRSMHGFKAVGMVPLEEHFPRELLTDNVIDWFFEQNPSNVEELDLDGIIDLGAEVVLDE